MDFNTKFLSEILYPEIDMESSFLYNKKVSFDKIGLFYFPVFMTEMLSSSHREIIYSMIRNRLYKWFPQVYEYTGSKLTVYYARKLKIKNVSYSEAKLFFETSHIQGMSQALVYIGLYDKTKLVACMSFSKPRSLSKIKDNNCEWEIVRFATLINTSVIGGASKLFKNFIMNFNPNSVVSFCDIRFSSLDPQETVYPKLGFQYAGYSKPNYRYRDPIFNKTYSRQAFQKHTLEKRLEVFNSALSEKENMTINGYIRQYDCGNHKFVWKRS